MKKIRKITHSAKFQKYQAHLLQYAHMDGKPIACPFREHAVAQAFYKIVT